MTPLRFRAWHKIRKEMVQYPHLHVTTMGYDLVFGDEGENRSYVDDLTEPPDDLVIMQSTGLKDKNGKEIFEGDVLDATDRIVRVVWHEAAGCWDSGFIRYTGRKISNGIEAGEWPLRATIIGNIYENPDFLS